MKKKTLPKRIVHNVLYLNVLKKRKEPCEMWDILEGITLLNKLQ